jgi:WhiB family redox-sensing transcriptional regulator
MVRFMGKPIGGRSGWQELARCATLTPKESDAIFFPKPGGKSKQADAFCLGCPVRDKCLDQALTLGPSAIGFWAGTTEPERRRMAGFLKMLPSEFDIPEPRNRMPRRIPVSDNVLGDPLFGVEGPSMDEELRMYGM